MHELHAALIALQELDVEIDRAQSVVASFNPRLQELEEPVTNVDREVETLRAKVEELRAQVHKLEHNAEQKRDRMKTYQERLAKPRSSREEAAVRAEMDLVRKALDADVTDVRLYSEQATRADLKLDDLRRNAEKIRAEIAPRRDELMLEKMQAEEHVAQLRARRENQAVRLDAPSRRLYERLRSSKSKAVLAPLTVQGACGNCFTVLPVQEQSMVRQGKSLHRCEACGVILYEA